MDLKEIRAEIERRKQRASELSVPKNVKFLNEQIGLVFRDLNKDPELVLPEIRQSYKKSGDERKFRFNGSEYCLVDSPFKEETDYFGGKTASFTRSLQVNGETVFELLDSTIYVRNPKWPDECYGKEEIKSFIEGTWVTEISELIEQIKTHRQETVKRKYPPEEDPQLKEEMKKFGL